MCSSALPCTAQWRRITAIPEPYQSSGIWLDVFFLPSNPQYGWICGFNGMVIRTTDGGETWQGTTVEANPLGRGMLESIQFVDSTVGYVSGPGGVFKSTDGGRTWRDILPPTLYNLWGSFFLTRDIGIVIGSGCGLEQQFWRTTNGGNSWTLFSGSVPGSGLSDAVIANTIGYPAPNRLGLGYAVSSGFIWRTLDTGRTWQPLIDMGHRTWQEEMSYCDGTFMIPFAGGPTDCSGGQNTGGAYTSTDTGRTWRRFETGKAMYGSFAIDRLRGWAVGSDATVIYTANGGTTWEYRNCGILPGANMDDVWFVNDTLGFVVGEGVYKSTRIPDPVISILGTTQFCEGDSTILQAPEQIGNTELLYQWSNGASTRAITVRQSGTYSVTITDRGNCRRVSQTVSIQVLPRPRAEITAATALTLCAGTETLLTARFTQNTSASSFPITTIWLQNGQVRSTNTITSPLQTTSIATREAGVYTLTVRNAHGCSISTSLTLEIFPAPAVRITASSFQACRGDSITLSAPQGFVRYQWSNGATSSSITVRANSILTVTVTDRNGCTTVSPPAEVAFFEGGRQLQIIETITGGTVRFDAVPFSTLFCRDVRIRNTHPTDTFTITTTFLAQNVEFSTPLGQFPLRIAPLQEQPIRVCFSPRTNRTVTDTIWISRECGAFRIPLAGQGTGTQLLGTTRCNAFITSLSTQRGIIRLGVSALYPQPIMQGTPWIFLDAEYSSDTPILTTLPPLPEAQIISLTGTTVAHYTPTLIYTEPSVYRYRYAINTAPLANGVYACSLRFGTQLHTQLFVVLR
jgi:photosystem II stability/assembly factor-like uncharacterized protein